MDSVLLKVQELSYSYHTLNGETPALDRVSFCLYRKEFLAIVGPSGCGKSTILSLIAGLLTPGSGGITFYGENGHQPGIGYMLQHDLLFEWRNVWQNVTLGLEIAHKDTVKNLERVHRMLSDYGLLEFQHKKPSQLSGGMRQRAALIRTMALEPDILLLDEPFSALDYQTRLTVSADIAAMIDLTACLVFRQHGNVVIRRQLMQRKKLCQTFLLSFCRRRFAFYLANQRNRLKSLCPVRVCSIKLQQFFI